MEQFPFARVLRYLYGTNGIPVWVFGRYEQEEVSLLYTSASRSGVRPAGQLAALFRYFYAHGRPYPVLHVVGDCEMFAVFRLPGDAGLVLAGPVFLVHPVQARRTGRLALDYLYEPEAAQRRVLTTPVLDEPTLQEYAAVLLQLFTGTDGPGGSAPGAATPAAGDMVGGTLGSALPSPPAGGPVYVSLPAVLDRELAAHIYRFREETIPPAHSYDMEQGLLGCVRHGDLERLAALPELRIPTAQGPSVEDPYRKFLYDMIALATLVTRAAIEGGLHTETAYILSDLYIRKLDATRTTGELLAVGRRMVQDFTRKVHTQRGVVTPACGPAVRRCVEYVRANLHTHLTLGDAAAECGLNEKYLSRVFLKQTGMRFSDFVQTERVAEACRLLAHTDMPLQEISNTLVFSSQSYFTKVFRTQTGLTPQQYRGRHAPPGGERTAPPPVE